MAQPGQVRTETRPSEVENLQKKYDGFVQKRNELNDLARQLRSERDLLNQGTKEFRDRLEKAKLERDGFNEQMREHKARRDEYQAQAKAMIGSRQQKAGTGDAPKSLSVQVRQLERHIQDVEFRHQTQPLTIADEREVLKGLKAKQLELVELRKQLGAQREIKVALDDIDASIDELFKRADEEHKQVQAFYDLASKAHGAFIEALEESRTVQKEANAKHNEFVATRARADELHTKAMEVRESILAARGEERAARDAARREITDYNKTVRSQLHDPRRQDEQAEDAIAALKKGGKIIFGV